MYLTEPLVRTESWVWNPYQVFTPIAGYGSCLPVPEIPRPYGWVPHHLPGTNTVIREFSDEYGVPFEASRGGAETMYPEYRKKLKQMVIPRAKVFDVQFEQEHAKRESHEDRSCSSSLSARSRLRARITKCATCKATCTCSPARWATSRSRSAKTQGTTACCWWTPGPPQLRETILGRDPQAIR